MTTDTLPPLANGSASVETASQAPVALRLCEVAFASIAALVGRNGNSDEIPELQFLRSHQNRLGPGAHWVDAWRRALTHPALDDVRLVDLAGELALHPIEIFAIALATAVDEQPMGGRALARVQAPIGGARPTLGLLASAGASLLRGDESAMAILVNGAAVRTGLLTVHQETAPIPERMVSVPTPLCFALAGIGGSWPGATIGLDEGMRVALPASTQAEAVRRAQLLAAEPNSALLLRASSFQEGRAVAETIARALDRQPVFIDTDKLIGFGPWLQLRGLLPVFPCELGPADRRVLPSLPGYSGPVLALAGPDGGVETARGSLPVWSVPVPTTAERALLWRHALGDPNSPLAETLARHHRHPAGRIAHLGRAAHYQRALRHAATGHGTTTPTPDDLAAAAWTTENGDLHSLAEPLTASVPDEALVTPPDLRASLDLLVLRCRNRDGLMEGLGPAAVTRYRPGVKALFTGPSGTGKTLAAGWLATHLGLPLYRVDLASVTSKYIGETEKNLAQLLHRAEQAEVILLFDEADSLFGKRTDIRDSNDRFANAQTNYLLQRIENYDGIVLLTSNSKARFDSAFSRRLDFMLEFNLPTADERRALWRAHLGTSHALLPAELNELSALADVAGGHIRNAVLTASLLAREAGRRIQRADCVRGLEVEFRKIGRPMPGGFNHPRPSSSRSPVGGDHDSKPIT